MALTTVQQGLIGTPVAGTGPTFSVWLGSNQTISNQTVTLLAANTKEFDTATCYNNTGSTVTLNGLSVPAYAFCPNVPGYYQINTGVNFSYSTAIRIFAQLYKNGALYKRLNDGTEYGCVGGTVVYLNGTGDFVQIYGYVNGSGTITISGGSFDLSWINGSMVRSA